MCYLMKFYNNLKQLNFMLLESGFEREKPLSGRGVPLRYN